MRAILKSRKMFAAFIALLILFSMNVPVFAASSSKTVTSTASMSLYLPARATGDSSVISFNVTGLPAGAIVTEVEIDADSNISWSGQGAILSTKVWVKNSSMSTYVSAPWGSLNKTTISTGLIGKPAAGTWSVYYTGTNISNYYSASKTYKNVKLKVYYNY